MGTEITLDELVKTKFLKAIETSVKNISGIADVLRHPMTAEAFETARYPLGFVFDEPENIERKNRIAMVTMTVQIELWVHEKDHPAIGDAADVLHALVDAALFTDTNVKYYAMDLRPERENSATKFYTDEFTGGIVLRYHTQYAHKWGDPYTVSK